MRARLPSLCCLLCAAAALAASSASAQVDIPSRFSATAPGGITAIGNTLGLSKDTDVNGPGVRDSIGTFTTLEDLVDDTPANAANPYPQGTTFDWHSDGSSAFLSLREGTELGLTDVLYAELIWAGSYKYGDEDVTADLDTAVTLSAGGNDLQVTPDPATALTIATVSSTTAAFPVNYYMRSADVTDFVRAQRSGEYQVRGVPATQTELINSLNAAGWTLVVAFRDDAEPLRNLTIFVGGSFVDENTQVSYSVDGFCAPPTGAVAGKAAISALEGDANLTGDQLLIAPDAQGAFVPLEGPNNPADNFFCSQINGADGQLDDTGTFGDRNQDAFAGTNIPGGRQGWDVTTVALSSTDGQLVADQRGAVLQTVTTGDSFVPTLAAFQIDVNAPNLTTSSILPDATNVTTGDTLSVTSVARNTGLADASSVVFKLAVPDGLALTRFTSDGTDGDANGQAVDAAALAAGVDEGSLAPGESRTVVIEMSVEGPPASGLFFVQPLWSYQYLTCGDGSPPRTETFSDGAAVTFVQPPAPDAGVTDPDAGNGGGDVDAGNGGGDDVDAGNGGGDDVDAGNGGGGGVDAGNGGGGGDGAGLGGDNSGVDEGCGCTNASGTTVVGAAAWLAALALLGRRKRRSPA